MTNKWVRLVALTLAVSCSTQGLSFVADHRVRIIFPPQSAEVSLPFDLRWESSGFNGRFAIFIDSSPMRPGRNLRSLVDRDDPCFQDPRCPDERWLTDRNIHVVEDTRLVVDRLPDRRGESRAKDRHELTIVLLDRQGRRAGESGFVREFIVRRDDDG